MQGAFTLRRRVLFRRVASRRRARHNLAFTVFGVTPNILAASAVLCSRTIRRTKTVRRFEGSSSIRSLIIVRISRRPKSCSGVGPLATSRSVIGISFPLSGSATAMVGRAAKLRRRWRAAFITIRVSHVEICERPSKLFKFRKAESKPSCKASSASSGLPMIPSAERKSDL